MNTHRKNSEILKFSLPNSLKKYSNFPIELEIELESLVEKWRFILLEVGEF